MTADEARRAKLIDDIEARAELAKRKIGQQGMSSRELALMVADIVILLAREARHN